MLTGSLVLVRGAKNRIIPRYLHRESQQWLEVAEGLLLVFREGAGLTRGELAAEIDELIGEEMGTLVHRGLAKVLEDRAEFEVVAEMEPDVLREKVFTAAAEHRRQLRAAGYRGRFRSEDVLRKVCMELNLDPTRVESSLFADLKDENRMLKFADLSAQRLIDRYNVALAQAVLLRSVRLTVEVRNERPARYRQLFRWLKYHRLLARVDGNMAEGYVLHIDGPLSLFSATNRYGLQMALFLPALLMCRDFRLDAELRWGPRKEPRGFHLESADGLVSHHDDSADYVPAEISAFLERFRQLAPDWHVSEATEIVPLGREGVWIPDYRFMHKASKTDVFVEILGFWKQASLERLLRMLPQYGPPRYVLAISERLVADEGSLGDLTGPVLRYKDIPSAPKLQALLETYLTGDEGEST
jgi:predicted nuclease of restriction endonuclease-like RecB superfamily